MQEGVVVTAAESRVLGKAATDGSSAVDSPPKNLPTVNAVVSDNIGVEISRVLFQVESSVVDLVSNTMLHQQVAERKATQIYKRRPQRVTHPGPANKSPYVDPTTQRSNPFLYYDTSKERELDEWLAGGRTRVFPVGSSQPADEFFGILRKPREWLVDFHIDAYLNVLRLRFKLSPEQFPKKRIAFLDSAFSIMWTQYYPAFLEDNQFFPPGALDYYNGDLPSYAKTGKRWLEDVDELYGVAFKSSHWVAYVVNMLTSSIDVMDSAPAYLSDKIIAETLMPIAHMIPNLLYFLANPVEKGLLSREPYRINPRDRTLPVNGGSMGDCGVYALQFIEHHAKNIPVPKSLNDKNIKKVRAKMAVALFEETFKHGTSTSALEHRNPVTSGYTDSVEILPPP